MSRECFMATKFTFEGLDYSFSDLSDTGQIICQNLFFTLKTLEELRAKHALMSRAKNAYISDLKNEVVEKKSGLDLSELFKED